MTKSSIYRLPSKFLNQEVPFAVIFPKNYEKSEAKFPVLYLLHGLFGRFDNWLTNTEILEYAADCSFIIVCAEGGDGWYADSPHLPHHLYESYFLRELIPSVEKKFKVDANRSKRMVAGLSMGGCGAFKFALRRPEMFCFAASMSGAFHAAEVFKGDLWTEIQPSINAVFGDDYSLRKQNDLFQIIENYPAEKISELPILYFDCGAEDGFLPINTRLAEIFRRRKIAHEFKIPSGGHDWNYWNTQIKSLLQKIENTFKTE
ncbi:MAG: alpha/beta hydrolase family protein [Acidobacteriota bacterium]